MAEYRGFDGYAAQRRAESLAEHELAELEAGTEAIERGMANGWLWALLVGGLVAAPFTVGISLIVSLVAGIAMSGGPGHMAKAAMPMSVDIVAPKAGCIRIVSALVTIALVLLAAGLILCVIAYNMGVQP